MKPFFDEHGSTIYHGKAEVVLPTFAPDRFATVITDPPYHLTDIARSFQAKAGSVDPRSGRERSNSRRRSAGFMGKEWDGGDVAFRPETWAAVLRVCKPGAFLLAFGGTRTFHRLTCAIEDGGWEIRDCLSWLYGSGFPKSLDISKAIDKAAGAEREVVGEGRKQKRMNGGAYNGAERRARESATVPATVPAKIWDGWGTALKPAWEPIIVAMNPLDGTFAENAQRWGVAGLHIDGGRIDGPGWSKADGQSGAGYKSGKFMGIAGRGEPTQRNGVRTSSAGRWPANVALDEAAAAMLDEQSGELTSNSGKPFNRNSDKHRNAYAAFAGRREESGYYGDAGGASRFFYCAKASKSDRGHGNDHPTVKPVALLKYLCKLTETPSGGEILDPFGGSMTTLVAAREAGRPAVAIEMVKAHCRIGRKRLVEGGLFTGASS